jgi:hypothetical protein
MKRHIFILFSVVLLVSWSWSQEEHTVPASALGPELPYTEVLKPPMPVSGLQMPLTFSSETPRSNYIMGGLQFGFGYDDNLLSTPTHHISEESYMVLPSLDVGQTRERWTWDLGYRAGLTFNQHVTGLNQVVHDLHLLFAYRLSPHVTAQIRENFGKTNGLFSGLPSNTPATDPGPLQQPNQSVITPWSDQTRNTTGLDLSYQFSATSLVGASGNFYFVNYDSPSGLNGLSGSLIDTHSWGGNGFYARRFASRHWAGATYKYQRLLFDPGNRTDAHRILLFYSISTSSHVTFSVWAGPEKVKSFIPSRGVVPGTGSTSSLDDWYVGGGADLSWEGRRTTFRLGYTHETTDGGGLAQAVNLQQVNGEVKRRIARSWTASLDLGYARNNPLHASFYGSAPYRSWIGGAGVDCSITNNLSFGLRYGRDQLRYENSTSRAQSSFRNRAWLSISYSFSRPLGR